MEDKKKTSFKMIAKKLAIPVILLVAIIAGMSVWKLSNTETEISVSVSESEGASELRKQLADESVTEVELNGEILVAQQLKVTGKKVITGTGSVSVADGATLEDGILVLSEGADVTMKSGTINANSCGNGIYVPKGAIFSLEGGSVSFASAWNIYNDGTLNVSDGYVLYAQENNIYTAGDMEISGGEITDAAVNNIYVAKGAEVEMTGGTISTGGKNNIFAEKNTDIHMDGEKLRIRDAIDYGVVTSGELVIDYANISRNLTSNIRIEKSGKLELNNGFISSSSGWGIRNLGSTVVNGGEISSNALSGIENRGNLKVVGGQLTYNTERAITNKIGGKLEVTGRDAVLQGSSFGIYAEEESKAVLKDVLISGNSTSNIRSFGEVQVFDSDLVDSGSNSISNFRNGYVVLKNVNIERTVKNHGIYNDRGEIEFENVVINSPASRAIQNKGGIVTGKNLKVSDNGGAAIGNNIPNDDSQGNITIDGYTTSAPRSNNVYCENGSITLKNASLAVAQKNSVRVLDGTVTMESSTIHGTVKYGDNSVYGLYTSGGEAIFKNVTIENTASQAVNNRGGSVKFYDVTIKNPAATAIHNRPDATTGRVGNIYGERVEVLGSATANLNNDAPGTEITLKDSTLNVTPKTNVAVTRGTVVLDGTAVLGTNGEEQKPSLYIEKEAKAVLKGDALITGSFGKGVNNMGTFIMEGGQIKGNKANAGAGISNTGTVTMTGGSVSENVSLTASGAGVLNNSGAAFTMKGGSISGNTSKTIGGGIALADKSVFTMTGGSVENNHAECILTGNGGGGGINVTGGSKFYFLGGTFSGNTMAETNSKGVASVGDAIRVSGPTSMLYMGGDATVKSDDSIYMHNEANIRIASELKPTEPINLILRKYTYGATVLTKDGVSNKNFAKAAEKFALVNPWYINQYGKLGNISDLGTDEVARIYNPDSSFAKEDGYVYYTSIGMAVYDVEENKSATIEIISDITTDYELQITGNRDITITDDGTTRTISRAEDFTTGRFFVVTGNSTLTLEGTGDDENPTLIFDGAKVPAKTGQFVIVGSSADDTHLENKFVLNKGVSLQNNTSTSSYGGAAAVYVGSMEMNGGFIQNNVSGSGAGAINIAAAKFTMNGGTIQGNKTAEETNGGAINVSAGGTFIMNDGLITGNTAAYYAGGVAVAGSMTMNGGTIQNNIASKYRGGGVNLGANSDFTMTGGLIKGNSAKTTGGGVSLQKAAVMTMTGGTIEGNTATTAAANNVEFHYANNSLTLSDKAVIESIYYYEVSGSVIRLQEDYQGGEKPVTIGLANWTDGYRVLAEGTYTEEQLSLFELTDSNYFLREDGTIELDKTPRARIGTTTYTSLQGAIDAVEEGLTETTVIELLMDVDVSSEIVIEKKNITIKDDGTKRSIVRNEAYTSGRLIHVTDGATLTLASTGTDEEGQEKLIFDGKKVAAENCQFIYLGTTGATEVKSKLIINSGVVMQNSLCSSGTGAVLGIYNGEVVMNGGKLINNTNNKGAGGVLNVATTNATFTMNGGVIRGNQAATNGGVANVAGTVTIAGGKITGNKAKTYGGVFYVNHADAVINVTSGSLEKNTADSMAGAIYIAKGSLLVSGGSINQNESASYAGAILGTSKSSNITVTGGEIKNNTAKKDMGGGVQLGSDCTMTISGGTISGNSSPKGGAGVNVGNGKAKLTVTGGTIKDNKGSEYDISLQVTTNEKLVLNGKSTIGTIYLYSAKPKINVTNQFTTDKKITIKKASSVGDYQVFNFDSSITLSDYFEGNGCTIAADGTIAK